MTHTFYSDPGHAWLKVPIKELEALGIERKISKYSYHNEGMAFLEEDQDAGVYLDAQKLTGNGEIKLEFKHTDEDSPIRGYDRFTER